MKTHKLVNIFLDATNGNSLNDMEIEVDASPQMIKDLTSRLRKNLISILESYLEIVKNYE